MNRYIEIKLLMDKTTSTNTTTNSSSTSSRKQIQGSVSYLKRR
ncbi:MAG TPA: hypothetical protein VE244_14765 [Nitrososphaeraceae archaeon]|nr:hypothetical protein [Nitrososphaeraceae archaeon]